MAVGLQDVLTAIRVESNTVNDAAAGRIQSAVTELVDHYAPNAPDTVKDQAVIQAVGYMWHAPASAPARQNFSNAFHNSGAAALLAPWRCHGAGVCQ